MIRAKGRIPEPEALKIFKGIVEGYAEIQRHRIVHRDLKPENIMFSTEGNPVICDFGYSEVGGYLPKPKMYYNVGSPAYMAPESITGSVYSENSEIWSLGTILYEMLEGKPYIANDKQVMQTIMMIKKSGLVYPAGVSEFSKGIIRDTMKLKPAERVSVRDLLMRLASAPGNLGGSGGGQYHHHQQQLPQSQPLNFPQTQPTPFTPQPLNNPTPLGLVQGRQVASNQFPFNNDKLNASYTF